MDGWPHLPEVKDMFGKIFDVVFGCSHDRYSFPRTVQRRNSAALATKMYVVCLDCGKEFGYDWDKMSVVPLEARTKHLLTQTTMSNQPV